MTSTAIVCSEAHASWLHAHAGVNCLRLSDQKTNRLHQSRSESSTDTVHSAHNTLVCQQLLHNGCMLVTATQVKKLWNASLQKGGNVSLQKGEPMTW